MISPRLLSEVAHGTVRGALGAMAMTGVRSVTVSLGLVDEPPPSSIAGRARTRVWRLRGHRQPHRSVRAEMLHWGVGAVAGAGYALLPGALRRRDWSGPAYGIAILGAFEAVGAPVLGLQRPGGRIPERAALAADHLVYGLVLSETRKQPTS
jgi:hypothetical protein